MPLENQELVVEILDIDNDNDSNLCVICLEKEKNCAFYPCGH